MKKKRSPSRSANKAAAKRPAARSRKVPFIQEDLTKVEMRKRAEKAGKASDG